MKQSEPSPHKGEEYVAVAFFAAAQRLEAAAQACLEAGYDVKAELYDSYEHCKPPVVKVRAKLEIQRPQLLLGGAKEATTFEPCKNCDRTVVRR